MWPRLILCLALCSRLAAAQGSAVVSGVVHDSIGGQALSGAIVQLVAADPLARYGRTAAADARGRFSIDTVPAGKYLIGFYHPMLDSLGVQAPLREVYVAGSSPVNADLAVPSPARILHALCRTTPDVSGMVIGVVRDAQSRAPVAGATVTAEWVELAVSRRRQGRRSPRHRATTTDAGWFAICNLPRSGEIGLSASGGGATTDVVALQMLEGGLVRRELYVGLPQARDGRLSGVVVALANGKPLPGAEVSVPGGTTAVANEQGEWTLASAPSGTRVLDVRAVGHVQERVAVDVVANAPAVRAALSAVAPLLETVRVTAARPRDANMIGFEERRRSSGAGRFITAADIEKRKPIVTSDLFRNVPGLTIGPSGAAQSAISMRGLFADSCAPAIYMDGNFRGTLDAGDIDDWASPEEVAGMEIYTGVATPPQFSQGMGGVLQSDGRTSVCGSIVIWTRSRQGPAGLSWRRRMLAVLGLAALTALSLTYLTRD